MGTIDSKAAAAALGAAMSTVVWTLLTWFNDTIAERAAETPESYTTVVGSSALILGFIFAYFTPNAASGSQ